MTNGRLTYRLAVAALVAASAVFSSCTKEVKEKFTYYFLRTASAAGLDQQNEALLEFKVDSLNVEYRKIEMRSRGSEDLIIRTFEMSCNRFERDIQECIFDKIEASSLEIAVGVYYVEDKKAESPIAEICFRK